LPLATQRHAHIQDPGAELIERVSGFWGQFGRIALGALGAAAAAGLIVFFTLRARSAAEEQAAAQLTEANFYFWQGEYPRSLQLAKLVSEQFASTASGADALRIAGDDAFWSGDFKSAVDYFRRYLDKTKSGVLRDAARRSYAYALESDHQFKAAADQYDALVGAFDRESSAEFLAAAARCYRALQQPAEARKRLQRLIDEYGDTSSANTAHIRLGELDAASP